MDSNSRASPLIAELSWGRMTVDSLGAGKDFKLWPGGGREWNWNETGTRHNPGIRPEDVEELIEHGVTTIVLSQGMLRALRTMPETLELMEGRGITVHVAETKEAARLYNDLARRGEAVGGLFHSTC